MKFARVADGVVVEIFTEQPEFHPDIMATIHEAPDDVEIGWTYDGVNYAPPPPTPAELEARFDPSPDNLGFTGTMLDMIEGGL